MFYKGQHVRSRFHGLGEVTMTGHHPRVRLLDGRECRVPCNTVRFAPPNEYEAEVENRMLIERYLTFRVGGTLSSDCISPPRTQFDLVAAMTRHARTPPLPFAEATPLGSSVLYFD